MTAVHGLRKLDAFLLEVFSEGREILINPDIDQIRKALSKVQARARTNLRTQDEATEVFRRVVQQGASSAHAGVRDCPRSFKFGITSTVILVARLSESMIGCAIGRQQVLPGEKGLPPVSADPFDNPRQWLAEIVSTLWTRLDDGQIAEIQHKAVAAAMELAARQDRRRTHEHGAERAGIKRRLQLQSLFRSTQPVYLSDLTVELRRIADSLQVNGEEQVTWRTFQLRWPSVAARFRRDVLGLFRQGVANRQDLAEYQSGSPKYSLSFTTWSGPQMIFPGTQIVLQVCSQKLSTAEGVGHRSTFAIRKVLREMAEHLLHPVTPETVGWFRAHVDDLHRLVFVDEVQSDVKERLLALASGGDSAAAALSKELADWQGDGFASVRHWARSIGYRLAMHSEESAATITGKTASAREWNVYYASLIKRGHFGSESPEGYPAVILVGD